MERKFLHVATSLERLSGKSTALLSASKKVLDYSGGHEGGASTLKPTVAVTEQPLSFNDECLDITCHLERDLGMVAGRIVGLRHFKAALDGTIAPLRILQTMFRIESAGSSEEVRSLFVALSAEIESLLVRMSTLTANEFEAIENAGVAVNGLISRLQSIHAQQLRTQKRRAEITESVKLLEKQIEASSRRDEQLLDRTAQVAEKISGIVETLQYQDILNQRLRHVAEGLRALAARSLQLHEKADTDDLGYIRDTARVESAQLQSVELVLIEAVEKLRNALSGLADDMAALDEESFRNEAASPTAACNGMVQVLLDTLRENLALIESTAVENEEIWAVLEPVGGLMGSLTGTIHELAARIRLIALNAQVQAAQADTGTGLEVLSAHTRLIAEDMDGIVAEVATELAALKEILNEGLRKVRYSRKASGELRTFLQQEGKQQELLLEGFRARMLAELEALEGLTESMQKEARDLSASLDIGTTATEVLRGAQEDLRRLSGILLASHGKSEPSAGLDDQMRQYTAMTERAIHAKALATTEDTAGKEYEPATAEGSVELF